MNDPASDHRPPLDASGLPEPTEVLLASASPRRRRLFAWLGIPYECAALDVDESLDHPLAADPPRLAMELASRKALAARAKFGDERLIIACDTIVVLDGEILGKPIDLPDAFRMLRALSGRKHDVITGLSLLAPGRDAPVQVSVRTNTWMRELSEQDMQEWAAAGDLLGCAGAYNIEAHLAFVESDECYQNVAGLPLCHLFMLLDGEAVTGVPAGLERPVQACDATRGVFCKMGECLVGR